jgi:hypothetical protein
MKKLLSFCILSLALPLAANAGSPDGLQLLVLNADNASPYKDLVQNYFKRYNPSRRGFDCDDAQLNIASAYQKVPPTGISAAIAIEAATKASMHKKQARALKRFRDSEHDRGFDGVVIYEVRANKLTFTGISAADREDVFVSEVPLVSLQNEAQVNEALCKAIVHLPILQAP